MKKGIKIALRIVILLFAINVFMNSKVNAETESVNGFEWTYTVEDGKAVDVYISSGIISNSITVPGELGGYPVARIGNPTANYNIANNVSTTSLTTIYLPSCLEEIGDYAFRNMQYLRTVGLEENNTTLPDISKIGNYAFNSCTALTEINIPSSITSIGYGAFYYCTALTEINIPDSVTTIGNSAFQNCTNLVNVTIGSGIENIGNYALYNIKDIYISREEGTVNIGSNNNGTIHYLNCKHKMNISVPEGIKVINTDTNEEITTGEIDCGESLNYKFIIEEGYEYNDLTYTLAIKPVYAYNYNPTQPNADVETIQTLNLDNTYSNINIIRDFKIGVQKINTGVDFVLRKYITKVNGLSIDEDRVPTFDLQDGKTAYLHSKTPVVVNSGDIVRYKIRIYNEGKTSGNATEIKEYLPESLQFLETSGVNSKYKWKVSEDGRTVTTDYLANNSYYNNYKINGYTGSLSTIQYKEVEIECKVLANRDEENKYIASITEITASNPQDADSTHGDITLDMLDGYKKEESLASNSSSYIHGEDDDFDYECILVPTMNDISTDYRIRVEKIDSLTGEMLNGAKFNLLNENGEILQEGVTEVDGVLDFGMMNSVGEGTDIYYIEEVERPEGYNNPLTYKVKLTVTKEIYDYINEKYTLDVKCDIADINVEVTRFEEIPIYTKEQLEKIGSNEEIYIEEADETFKFDNLRVYKLMQDIDLQDQEWTPLNAENCMLDGNGFAIKNLKIETDLQDIEKVGLFSTYSGYIANLTLENVNIIEQKTSGVTYPTDKLYTIGGLVGYMSEGIIKNCNVTGTITADIDNVGGFVGHSEKEKIIIFKNCENNANVTTTQKNIGGLIGCVKGAININECTNKGEIKAENITNKNNAYNAGGLIGCADPDGYEMSAIKASYDKKDNIITLVVKNDSIIGKYKLKLENIDIETLKLIEGSTFDILDENKTEVYRGVELENGQLEIATVDITTIGTDVYYLKQVTTPEGYEILVNNEYIKAIVNKKWDKVNDKYVVEVDTEIINKEEYEQEKVPEDKSTSKTGIIHKIMEYTNVTWTTNKVAIQNSKNEGNIYSSYLNAAGLLGRGKTSIEIEKCENTGNIEVAQGHAGGLLGEITKANELSFSYIYDSTNKGTVLNNTQPSNNDFDIAGIVSYIEQDLTIDNCSNEGAVSGVSVSSAGIVGCSLGNIKASNCKNIGEILVDGNGRYMAAGIVGKRYKYDEKADKRIIIENCYNSANITGSGHTAGIIGIVSGEFMEITGCTTENCTINTSEISSNYCSVGGIVANVCATVVKISNCEVNNISMNNLASNTMQTAGILADINVFSNSNIRESCFNWDVNIDNCNVLDSNIITNYGNCSGIIAFSGYGYQNDICIKINKCNVNNSNIITKIGRSDVAVTGIYGQGYQIKQVHIGDCNVENSTIKCEGEGNYKHVAGIYGTGYTSDKPIDILIKNTQLISSNIYNNGTGGDVNTAGILSQNYISGANSKVDIIDSKVYDCDIQAYTGNVGGIYNVIESCQENNYSHITNCTVEKTRIQETNANLNDDSMGGIAGAINIYTIFKNCNVIDSEIINSSCRNTAGIVGFAFDETQIIECNVENTNIKSTSINGVSCVAGIITLPFYETYIYRCNVRDLEIEGNGIQVGGIMTCSPCGTDGSIIEETNVDNVEIKFNTPGTSYQSAVGGLVAGAGCCKYKIKNSNFLNSNITSNATSTGGILGCAWNDSEIIGCKTENATITTEGERLYSNYYYDIRYYGGVGGIIADYGGTQDVKDCVVKNVKIETTTDQIGGIIATVANSINIDNCTIDNLICTNKNTIKTANCDRTIGGIVGVSNTSVNINTPIIKNLTINAEEGENTIYTGGLIGYVDTTKVNNANIGGTNEDGTTIKGINIENNTPNGLGGGFIAGALNVNITESSILNSTLSGKSHIGGTVGFATIAKVSDTNLDNVNIECTGAYGMIGGIYGLIAESAVASSVVPKATIERTSITNSTVIGQNHVGGNIGVCRQAEITESTIDNVTVTSTSSSSVVGGMTAIASNVSVTDSSVLNSTITGANHVGGVIGVSPSSNVAGTTIDNVDIETTGVSGGTALGGIVAIATYGNGVDISINNSNITDLTMRGNNHIGGLIGVTNIATVKDTTVDNLDIETTGASGIVGGITAVAGKLSLTSSLDKDIVIENSNITNSKIKGLNYAGGNIGVTRTGKVTGSTLDNVTVESTGESGIVSGICALASNGNAGASSTDSEIVIEDSNVLNSTLSGLNHVGGCIGFATIAEINGSTVNNTSITSTGAEGIVGGFAGAITNTNSEINNGALRTSKITITNSKLIDVIQTGLSHVDEFIGLGVLEKLNTTSSTTK